jgi:hypothetical protein
MQCHHKGGLDASHGLLRSMVGVKPQRNPPVIFADEQGWTAQVLAFPLSFPELLQFLGGDLAVEFRN